MQRKDSSRATESLISWAADASMELDTMDSREDLIVYLERNYIMTRFIMPLINQPIIRKLYGNLDNKYPVASYINDYGFCIGVHPELTKSDLDYVIMKFNEFYS